MTAQYAGTGTLAKLSARRDRIRLPVWVYAIVALVASTAYSFKGLYPTVAQRIEFARSDPGQQCPDRGRRPHLRRHHHRWPDRVAVRRVRRGAGRAS